ncbi:MAG: hypothetical protein ACRDZN_13885 [Acidimicrobiales bacterium]
MTAAAMSPAPSVDLVLALGDTTFDLRWRALVAAVVPAPRFGREGEVVAGVRTARDAGADLADVSLSPRLIGPAAGAGLVPVLVRATSVDEAAAARRAGAGLVLVRADIVADVAAGSGPVALLVDDVAHLDHARAVAEHHGIALAIDVAGRPPADATAIESAGIARGCRVVCTADVRRTRRVVETLAALLEARREVPGP